MLKGKTIQMDPVMIEDIQKRMIAQNNFSFQAMAKEYIEIGLEAERSKGDLYKIFRHLLWALKSEESNEIKVIEEILYKLDGKEAIEFKHSILEEIREDAEKW